jgi:capsular polysaccharide biosynthesis protein/MinD-like ATPase involved in chromosome partitioning or flagellar assembly
MHMQDTLRHYAQVICKHFRFILLAVIFGSTITCIISLLLPPVYQASALVKVDSVLTTPAATASGNDVFSAQAQAVSYAILVTSPEVLQEAAKKLPGITIDQLKKAVSDSPVDNTQLIEVRANDDNPQRTADIANTVATTFVQFQETQERTRLQNAADQLSQNLTQAKINIDTAQKQLTTLQNTHAAEDSIAQQQSLLATYQSTYNALLSSNEQLQTQEQLTTSMLSVAQQALPPDKPTSPQIALNTVIATSMTMLLMITLVLLRDWLDVTIKSTDDVIQLTGLEPLGGIPVGTSTSEFDLRSEHTDEVKDAYSMLATPFRVLSRGERAILVTSPRSGSGTTTAATYLALSLAKSGMRVLLVDANVRRPSLHNILLCSDTQGPVESLQDIASWKESSVPLPHLWLNQWKTDIPNLWLLPSGPLGQASTSLLYEPALGRFLDRLLGRMPDMPEQLQPRLVDIIIFDTVALDQGTDVYLLAAIADATVLIVEAGKEHKDTLHRLRVTFEQFGAPILGVVVNRQQEHHRSYFYTPHQVSTERKVVLPSSLDQAQFLPLPQENNNTVSGLTNSAGKEKISIKRSLTLRSLVGSKDAFRLYKNEKDKSEYISGKGLGGSVEIENVGFKLPETPMPLPSVYSDLAANQTDEAQDDVPGRQQFAPLLRFSRAMSQVRDNERTPEV